jgi:hypothetical protein
MQTTTRTIEWTHLTASNGTEETPTGMYQYTESAAKHRAVDSTVPGTYRMYEYSTVLYCSE